MAKIETKFDHAWPKIAKIDPPKMSIVAEILISAAFGGRGQNAPWPKIIRTKKKKFVAIIFWPASHKTAATNVRGPNRFGPAF